MGLFHAVSEKISGAIVRLLTKPSRAYQPFAPSDPETLRRTLRPADVLLVEGNEKISTAIKYLTQSTWSHAALFVGNALESARADADPAMLVEVDLVAGCVVVPISKYQNNTTRICRPVGLSEDDRRKVMYGLTPKGIDLLPAMLALRQWGEKYGLGVPSNPVLVDKQDGLPIGPIAMRAHDGRVLAYEDLQWRDRSEVGKPDTDCCGPAEAELRGIRHNSL